MIKRRSLFLGGAGTVLVVLATVGVLWALCPATYNRPNPRMDYVPQETGIFDTMYWEHTEHNCRECHGNSLADRHHMTEIVLKDGICTLCHTVDPGEPSGVRVERNCMASGCHDTYDNGWHHNTDMAAAENCIACHNPSLIEEITPFRDHEMYPPSLVTPTPFSCENCHWEQQMDAGHPSTKEHYDAWGNFVGDYEYPKPIYGNFDTHHMGFEGLVVGQCYKCHSQDPNEPSWNPYNPELGRYCQICHSIATLHRVGPHVSAHMGWEAVGFHVPETNTDCTDLPPTNYISYTADDQCLGCHGDGLPAWFPEVPDAPPAIDTSEYGILPAAGSCGAIVTLRGDNFGEEHTSERSVQMKLQGCSACPWVDVPIHAWTDTLIEFEIPCWTFQPGNYRVRVVTEKGNSNVRIFTLEDSPTAILADPDSGPCGTWITISGHGGFGNVQSKMYDSYTGVHHMVDFVCSAKTYTALNYKDWSDKSFKVRIWNTFKDSEDDDPNTGRNFVQDDGSGGCDVEDTIKKCDCMALGVYSIYVKAIYFGDEDGSGSLTCGDTIFEVEKSDPVYFELTNQPMIYKLNPWKIERGMRLKIYGVNFGPTQGSAEVRIGSLKQYNTDPFNKGKVLTDIRSWSNTLIKVTLKKSEVPESWEGQKKYVWVVKGGLVSLINYPRPLKILEPL